MLTEGIPDGLTVAHTGVQPVAVVGTGNTGPDVAARLHDAFRRATFVVAFDNDTAGRATGPKLGAHLAELGHTVVATAPAAPAQRPQRLVARRPGRPQIADRNRRPARPVPPATPRRGANARSMTTAPPPLRTSRTEGDQNDSTDCDRHRRPRGPPVGQTSYGSCEQRDPIVVSDAALGGRTGSEQAGAACRPQW